MQIDLPFPAFKQLVADVQAVFQASDLGAEAVRDGQAACRLITVEDRLEVEVQYRGLEVVGHVAGQVARQGHVAVPFGQLGRLAVQAATCRLTGSSAGLDVRAGRLKANFQQVDQPARATREGPDASVEFQGPDLKRAIDAVELTGQLDRQPFVAIRTGPGGARVWTHNPFNAGHTIVDRTARDPGDLVVPAAVIRQVAGTGPVGLGVSPAVLTVKTDRLTCWHPVRPVQIEDLDQAFRTVQAGHSFAIQADELAAGLAALRSAGGSTTPASTVDLRVQPDKGRVLLQVGTNRYVVELVDQKGPATRFSCNTNMLTTICRRLRGQVLQVEPPGDRIWVRTADTIYVMAPIQESLHDPDDQRAS